MAENADNKYTMEINKINPITSIGSGTKSRLPMERRSEKDQSNDTDEVCISREAKMLGKLSAIDDVRQEKIELVKAKIQQGKLFEPPNLKNAVMRMIIFSMQNRD